MREVEMSPEDAPVVSTPSERKIVEAHADGYVTGAEAADIVGVTYRRIDHSARIGIAPPAVEASGSGTLRLYDLDALVRVKIVTDLFALGLRDSKGLRGVLDQVANGESVTAVAGCISIDIDPACARRILEPKYRSIIDPDPTED